MEGCCSCIWCCACYQQGRHLGTNHGWEASRARKNWNSCLSLSASNFRDAGDLQEKLVLFTTELPTYMVQNSEMLKDCGSWSSCWPTTAPHSHAESAQQDSMCESQQCLHRHSKCGSHCSFTSSFKILYTVLSPVVNPNPPPF